MATRTFNREQTIFITNYERAVVAGVEYKTGEAVYHALLRSASFVAFNGVPYSLTDGYVSDLNDELFNRAVEQGQSDNIRWVGDE